MSEWENTEISIASLYANGARQSTEGDLPSKEITLPIEQIIDTTSARIFLTKNLVFKILIPVDEYPYSMSYAEPDKVGKTSC